MPDVKSQLSITTRKAVAVMEKKFPKLAKELCSDRREGFCEKTGRRCKLESCPKMKERLKEYV